MPHRDFQLHAQVIGELLGELIIEPVVFIIDGGVGQWGLYGTDAQLPPLFDRGDTILWFAKPGN